MTEAQIADRQAIARHEANEFYDAQSAAHVQANWHGFGTQLKADATIAEIEDAAGIGWTVSKQPVHTVTAGGVQRIVPGKFALVRDDTQQALDIVGKDWKVNQNRRGLELFDSFIDQGKLSYVAAGTIRNGSTVFVQAKTEKGFTLFSGKDAIEQIITFYNPHRQGSAVLIDTSANRLFCLNQMKLLSANAAENAKVRFQHVGADRQFSQNEALRLLGATGKAFEVFEERARLLAGARCTDAQTETYLRTVFKIEEAAPEASQKEKDERSARNRKIVDKLLENHWEQPGVDAGLGTWWQAFNGVTHWVDHRGSKGADIRASSALLGDGSRRKQLALELAVAGARS